MFKIKKLLNTDKSVNLVRFGVLFALFYWILESVRDVIVFQKGPIIQRVFFPDMMSFWMRFLVVCIIMLFSAYAHSLQSRLEKRKDGQPKSFDMMGIMKAGIGISILYWLLESFRDSFVFHKGPILERIITPDPMSLWMRLLAIFIIFLFTIYAQALINERRKAEEALREEQEKLERLVKERTAELTESNRLLRLLKTEIAERNRVEEELRRVNRALKTFGESNMALVRATEELALLKDVCNVIVEEGGYRLVWVGYAKDDDIRTVRVVSKAGWDDGYLDKVSFTWNDSEGDQNPIGRAIRGRKPCIVKIGKLKSNRSPWCIEAVKRDYAASISFPLIRGKTAFGALNIYSTEIDAFDENEVSLLGELSNDLAFGIMVLRTRTAHKRAESENERIQAQLIQARKMEAIGILAGGIAHDFNNLLTAILGCADMAMMDMDENNSAYGDLKEIQASAEHAAELTRQLLLFSRKQPMRFLPIDLNKIIQNLIKMLHRLIGEDIRVKTDLDESLWKVRADQGTIEQVIMNLALNARDAMPNGGELVIKTKNVVLDEKQCEDISEAQPGKWVRISVSDTGAGIGRKIIRHIFEPFFSTKDVGEGTGLGLSVVYGIVKQHEGWMHVTSQSGRGSVFQVYLPESLMKYEEKIDKNLPPEKVQEEGKRVLVVEDEEKVRKFTTTGLDRSGFTVFAAADAEEAAQIFKREKGDFNVVLCDVVLPGKNGLELIDEFLSFRPQLGILMSSGYTGQKSQRSVIRERGFRFLEKPYSLNDLLRVIREITTSDPA